MVPSDFRVLVATEPTDFRKSYDGLCGVVRDVLGKDPQSPTLFVFRNKRADQLRILWWDGNGYAIWMKRLSSGTFKTNKTGEVDKLSLIKLLSA